MKGLIITNGYYDGESYIHQIARIYEEFQKKEIDVSIYKNSHSYSTEVTFDCDFAVFLDKDIHLARIMEERGIIVFNNSYAIEDCDNKIKTIIKLSHYKDIMQPPTLIAPIRYKNLVDMNFINEIENSFEYPIIAKKAVGSLGDGLFLIKDRKELEETEENLSMEEHLYQPFIAESAGKSVRAFVVGNKTVASMLLTNENDFRSNVGKGSIAENVELDENYTKTAEKISRYLDLDFCAIDFFVGAEIVIEVNSNPFFKQIEETTGTNIAKIYVDFIIEFLEEII